MILKIDLGVGLLPEQVRSFVYCVPANRHLQHVREVTIYGMVDSPVTTFSTSPEHLRERVAGSDLLVRTYVEKLSTRKDALLAAFENQVQLQLDMFFRLLTPGNLRELRYQSRIKLLERTREHIRKTQRIKSIGIAHIDWNEVLLSEFERWPDWFDLTGADTHLEKVDIMVNCTEDLLYLLAVIRQSSRTLQSLKVELNPELGHLEARRRWTENWPDTSALNKWNWLLPGSNRLTQELFLQVPKLKSLEHLSVTIFDMYDIPEWFWRWCPMWFQSIDPRVIKSIAIRDSDVITPSLLNLGLRTGFQLSSLDLQLSTDICAEGARFIESQIQLRELKLRVDDYEEELKIDFTKLKKLKQLSYYQTPGDDDKYLSADLIAQIRTLECLEYLEAAIDKELLVSVD